MAKKEKTKTIQEATSEELGLELNQCYQILAKTQGMIAEINRELQQRQKGKTDGARKPDTA